MCVSEGIGIGQPWEPKEEGIRRGSAMPLAILKQLQE